MPNKIERQTYKIDAAGKATGRLATQVALLLRGKNKPEFQPHVDAGNIVEISNIGKLKFTGNKLAQKKYHHYSGYPGGLKTVPMNKIYEEKPAEILKKAVWNMLPKNKLRKEMIKRLKIL